MKKRLIVWYLIIACLMVFPDLCLGGGAIGRSQRADKKRLCDSC